MSIASAKDRPLDNLSDSALRLMADARKHGMTWIHPSLIDSPGPVRELIEAGILRVHPLPVRAVYWPWEVRG